MINKLKRIWHPEIYHGFYRNDNFFEGWFFKIVDAERKDIIAVIPGIFKSRDKTKAHSFIQVLDGSNHNSYYIKYKVDEFVSANDKFAITIGDNKFTREEIDLNINSEKIALKGKLEFSEFASWHSSIFSPGIMGWYSFVPFMECNHGIVSLDHKIEGSLSYNDKKINCNGGRGYIEKDWGSSFPSSYVWVQSNHFSKPGISLTGSIARIPWLFSWFRGFIIGLQFDNHLYRFATYTGAELEYLKIDDELIRFSVHDKKHKMKVTALRKDSGTLHAPYDDMMTERVTESLASEVEVKLTDRTTNKLIFSDKGYCSGLDVNGKLGEIEY